MRNSQRTTLKLGVNEICESLSLVEPGPFRTDWAGRSIVESKTIIDDYAQAAGVRRKQTREHAGNQPGDPVRGAQTVIDAVDSSDPPLRLLRGKMAFDLAQKRLDSLKANFDAWKDASLGADLPDAR